MGSELLGKATLRQLREAEYDSGDLEENEEDGEQPSFQVADIVAVVEDTLSWERPQIILGKIL